MIIFIFLKTYTTLRHVFLFKCIHSTLLHLIMSTCSKEGCCKKCPIEMYKEKKAALDQDKLKEMTATVASKLESSKDFIKFWLSATTLNYVPFGCFVFFGIVAIVLAFKLPENVLFNLCFTLTSVCILVFAQKKFLITAMQKFVEKQEYEELYNKLVENIAAIKIMCPCECPCCCCESADMKKIIIRFGVMCGLTIFFYFVPLRWIMLLAFVAVTISIVVCFLTKNEKFMEMFNKYMWQIKDKIAEMKKGKEATPAQPAEEPKAEEPPKPEPEQAEEPAEVPDDKKED